MILVDTDIRKLIASGALYADDELSSGTMDRSVGAISYDLHTRSYVSSGAVNLDDYLLAPGESVFVSCCEIVNLPSDLCARIVIRNSRLRQGLSVEAPVYQPGHHTRLFFRVSNISAKAVSLNVNSELAAVMFERLSASPEAPYRGTFQNEMAYKDMADYSSKYREELSVIDAKMDEVKHLEKNIYTNIITLMSIFIALFSLINVNVDIAFASSAEQSRILVSNLINVGSIAFLVALIQLCSSSKGKRGLWVALLILALLILVGASFMILLKK